MNKNFLQPFAIFNHLSSACSLFKFIKKVEESLFILHFKTWILKSYSRSITNKNSKSYLLWNHNELHDTILFMMYQVKTLKCICVFYTTYTNIYTVSLIVKNTMTFLNFLFTQKGINRNIVLIIIFYIIDRHKRHKTDWQVNKCECPG